MPVFRIGEDQRQVRTSAPATRGADQRQVRTSAPATRGEDQPQGDCWAPAAGDNRRLESRRLPLPPSRHGRAGGGAGPAFGLGEMREDAGHVRLGDQHLARL